MVVQSFKLASAEPGVAKAGFGHEVWLSMIRPNWRPSTPPRFGWPGVRSSGERRASGYWDFLSQSKFGWLRRPRAGCAQASIAIRTNRSYRALMRSVQDNRPGVGWNQDQDDLLRQLVEDAAPPEMIADRLNRTVTEVRRRGDTIGLPLKWYQRISHARGVFS
jgi:hypothetical protein